MTTFQPNLGSSSVCKAFTEAARSFYTHKRQEIIAADEDGGNNVMECSGS